MIDNVILLITGTLHQRSIAELVPKCHPLGSFEQMEAVNIAQTPAELYNAILVDTPLGEPLVEGGVGISTSASVCGLRTPGGDPDSELRPTHWLAFKLPLGFPSHSFLLTGLLCCCFCLVRQATPRARLRPPHFVELDGFSERGGG